MRLDIGGKRRGWTSVDLYDPDADVRAHMGRLPVRDGCVETIRSAHALEHVPSATVMPVLREWRRVLAPSGALWLEVPDLDYVCRQWLEHTDDAHALRLLFGLQTDAGQFHQTGFSASTLAVALRQARFSARILRHWSHEQVSLVAEASCS